LCVNFILMLKNIPTQSINYTFIRNLVGFLTIYQKLFHNVKCKLWMHFRNQFLPLMEKELSIEYAHLHTDHSLGSVFNSTLADFHNNSNETTN